MNILIVDDDEAIREMLVLLFEMRGIDRIESAVDGHEGFAKLTASPEPRLVMLDLMMPVANGWEFLRRFESRPDLRNQHEVVLMSASRPDPGELAGYQFFQKPIEIDKIFALLEARGKGICPGV